MHTLPDYSASVPYSVAPHDDLLVSRISDDSRVRNELLFQWAKRLLRQHAPTALHQLGYEGDATALRALASESFDAACASRLFELARRARVIHDEHRDLMGYVTASIDGAATAIGHVVGALRSVLSTWIEGVGPGVAIEQSDADLLWTAKCRVVSVGAYARTIAHIVGGEQGYVAEVIEQYAELYPDGDTREHQDTWGEPEAAGSLVADERYRVYAAFDDLDGVHHPWGESWRFDGCTFSPTTCELRLKVSEGVQLDPKGRPGPKIQVAPFRVAIAVGDRPGRARDVIRSCIVKD